ncbi:MAG: hypothetical protein NTU88_13830 [Armatimonadetes bacterium]|nr:hypothetical protein [Armatimonadota bacterium]
MALYFDWEKMAQELGLPDESVARIVEDARREFPDDPMMCELHIIRALRSAHEASRGAEAA